MAYDRRQMDWSKMSLLQILKASGVITLLLRLRHLCQDLRDRPLQTGHFSSSIVGKWAADEPYLRLLNTAEVIKLLLQLRHLRQDL